MARWRLWTLRLTEETERVLEALEAEEDPEEELYRLGIVMHVQTTMIGVGSSLGAITAYLEYPDFTLSSCLGSLRWWVNVWILKSLFQSTMAIVGTSIRKRDLRTGMRRRRLCWLLAMSQRLIQLLSLIWFAIGTKIVWFDGINSCAELEGNPKLLHFVYWANFVWWLQAVLYLLPCCIYSLLCLCFPCIAILVMRAQLPIVERRPTPDHVLRRLTIKTYRDAIEAVKQNFGSSVIITHSPAPSPVRNPLNQVINAVSASLATSTGIGGGASAMISQSPTPQQGEFSDPLLRGRSSASEVHVNTTCPICMGEFEEMSHVMVMPCDCRHFFHPSCVKEWLRGSQLCPMCRANISHLVLGEELHDMPSGELEMSSP